MQKIQKTAKINAKNLPKMQNDVKKDVKTAPDCPFCDIRDNKTEKIVHQSENTFAFHDRNSGRCKVHLMVCPRKCIKNYKYATKDDLGEKYRLGFHKPPFYSIKHLHLHICVEPINGCYNKIVKYGWNMKHIDDVIKNLEKL